MDPKTSANSKIKDAFYAGFYKYILDKVERENLHFLDSNEDELYTFFLRAKACLDSKPIEISSSSLHDSVLSTLYFINFWNASNSQEKESFLSLLKDLAAKRDPIAKFLASSALCAEERQNSYTEALRMTRGSFPDLKGLRIMELCYFDFWSIALNSWNSRTRNGHDPMIFRLVDAVMTLAKGNYQEAFSLYSDIEDEYFESESAVNSVSSILILNAKAVCSMQNKEWEEASLFLQEAYKLNPLYEATVLNLITCSSWKNDHEDVNRRLQQLQDIFPSHPLLAELQALDTIFDQFSV